MLFKRYLQDRVCVCMDNKAKKKNENKKRRVGCHLNENIRLYIIIMRASLKNDTLLVRLCARYAILQLKHLCFARQNDEYMRNREKRSNTFAAEFRWGGKWSYITLSYWFEAPDRNIDVRVVTLFHVRFQHICIFFECHFSSSLQLQ